MTQLPILKSETFTPDGDLASWMLDAERGKKALAKARARRHLMDFIKYTFPEYDVNWHHEIICKYLERWAFGTGRWAIKRLMIFAPPGSGKALEINTPIPVPSGWKSINELNIGDEVFDENGQICHVIAKSPIWKNRDIYKVTIDRNHDEILADGNHIWKVHLWNNKDSSLHLTKDLSGRKSHRKAVVKVTKPLELPSQNLPIDPYVLGVWLGDGCSYHATITQGEEDLDFVRKEFIRLGYRTTDRNDKRTFGILGIQGILKKLGMMGYHKKYVPIEYLRASKEQRLALLQGLIDTDGYVAPSGAVEFYSTNIRLANAVYEIAASFGCKPSFIIKDAKLNGRFISKTYLIRFFLKNAARLPRKSINCKNAEKYINHTIRVEPAGKGNTVCIQVDSPSGMFLCGKSMIPTHNSELVSRRLPAWIFGRNPDVGIMTTSYSASLAQDMNVDVQRIINSDLYSEIFPETFLSGKGKGSKSKDSWAQNKNVFEIVSHKGYYKCAGVGGSITGKRFFYGIIDDPLRGRKDAESETIRNGIYNWYINDFFTRKLNTDARILITLTRWHEYDLAGRLLAMAKADPRAEQWTVVKFPLIAEDPIEPYDIRKIGDPLWINRYGTSEEIESIKISAGTYVWSSLYQQRPTPPGGSVFNRGWWGDVTGSEGRNQFYNQDPQEIGKLCQHLILSADCTLKDTDGTDFVVVQIWGKESGNFYLLDQSRKRQDIIGTMQTIQALSAKWPRVTAKLIEDTANGPAVIKLLKKEIPGLIPIPTRGESKTSRAIAVTPLIESGNVWLPHPKWAPWLHDFLEELASFPNGTHDDQVDCLSQSLNYLNTRTNFMLPKLPNRPIRMPGGWTG